jgi:methyl-accepting chemotaxis protein
MSLARKFALLGLLGAVLFLLPFFFHARHTLDVLETLRQERAGIAPTRALLQIAQLTQQHRGMFNGGLLAPRAAKQAEADAAYASFGAGAASAWPQALRQEWEGIARDWNANTAAIAAGQEAKSAIFLRHNALIAREFQFVVLLAEHYGLAFDADPTAHHLVTLALRELPQLSEAMGQARALGTAYVAAGQVVPAAQAPIAALVQTGRLRQAEVEVALRKATASRPALDAALNQPARSAIDQARRAFALVEREVLGPIPSTMEPASYYRSTTEAIDAQFAFQAAAADQLQVLFESRVAADTRLLLGLLVGLLVAALAVILWGMAIARSISRPLADSIDLAQRVAGGDLTVALRVDRTDELGELQRALSTMVARLQELLAEVAAGAHRVSDTSAQIAQGNLDLSQRTEEQAVTLEETASSMEQLTTTVAQNAESARQASELARSASQVARKGGEAVGRVVSTMDGIAGASRRIGDIIGVIDGIAFQTNILALNAAVEAARAGHQGRGFAVVAQEVRSLSQRSAAAAREIKALIDESVGQVETGTRMVDAAGRTMEEIVTSVQRVSDLVAQIAAANGEQSAGIGQVNIAMSQMDHVVQQNASLVEEAAAATEAMKEQAAGLLALVSRFRLHHAPQGTADPLPLMPAARLPALGTVAPQA